MLKHMASADCKHNTHILPKKYLNADVGELIRLIRHEARVARMAYSAGEVLTGDMGMQALEGYLAKLDAHL